MPLIDWDGGGVTIVQPGDTARCTTLGAGEIYAIFLYNASAHAQTVTVTVVWSQSNPPQSVTVPSTGGGEGPATLVLVSGNDTSTVSLAILGGETGSAVQCWILGAGMPTDTTGMKDATLAPDGVRRPLEKLTRYSAVPPSQWCGLAVASTTSRFVAVQMTQAQAAVLVCNPTSWPVPVTALGSVAAYAQNTAAVSYYTISPPVVPMARNASPPQTLSFSLQGDGSPYAWMSADSPQNSANATIVLQSLTMFRLLRRFAANLFRPAGR